MMIDKVCNPSACCHNLLGTITLIILDDDDVMLIMSIKL